MLPRLLSPQIYHGRKTCLTYSRLINAIKPMAWTREASDTFARAVHGYSQEYLDECHKRRDAYHADLDARGVGSRYFEPLPSESSWDDDDDENAAAPLSPPSSAKREKVDPDLSRRAWNNQVLYDMSSGIEPRYTGFVRYDKWRSYVLSKHTEKVRRGAAAAALQLEETSGVRKNRRSCRPTTATQASER